MDNRTPLDASQTILHSLVKRKRPVDAGILVVSDDDDVTPPVSNDQSKHNAAPMHSAVRSSSSHNETPRKRHVPYDSHVSPSASQGIMSYFSPDLWYVPALLIPRAQPLLLDDNSVCDSTQAIPVILPNLS